MTTAPHGDGLVDLAQPSADLGLRLVIEASTDPAERQRVATDPGVVAVAARAAELTPDQRRRISDAYATNFNVHRATLTRLHHRVRHAGGPNHLTTRALNERLHDLLDCPAQDACGPYHTCGTGFFTSAVQDAIFARLAADHLTADEARLFTGPWVDVGDRSTRPGGQTGPVGHSARESEDGPWAV